MKNMVLIRVTKNDLKIQVCGVMTLSLSYEISLLPF